MQRFRYFMAMLLRWQQDCNRLVLWLLPSAYVHIWSVLDAFLDVYRTQRCICTHNTPASSNTTVVDVGGIIKDLCPFPSVAESWPFVWDVSISLLPLNDNMDTLILDASAVLIHLSTFRQDLMVSFNHFQQNVPRSKLGITEPSVRCQCHVLETLVHQPSAAADVPAVMWRQMAYERMGRVKWRDPFWFWSVKN